MFWSGVKWLTNLKILFPLFSARKSTIALCRCSGLLTVAHASHSFPYLECRRKYHCTIKVFWSATNGPCISKFLSFNPFKCRKGTTAPSKCSGLLSSATLPFLVSQQRAGGRYCHCCLWSIAATHHLHKQLSLQPYILWACTAVNEVWSVTSAFYSSTGCHQPESTQGPTFYRGFLEHATAWKDSFQLLMTLTFISTHQHNSTNQRCSILLEYLI